jgi:hypothetical protein
MPLSVKNNSAKLYYSQENNNNNNNNTPATQTQNADDGIAVLGTNLEERSSRDMDMLSNFSCGSRENYAQKTNNFPKNKQ